MKIYNTVALVLLLSTSAASSCEVQKVVNVDFGYMRAKPTLHSEPLWKLGNDVSVIWCGRTSTDSRGIVWNWVATQWDEEQWAHKGWISSRIVDRYVPTIMHKETPPPERFEDGGE